MSRESAGIGSTIPTGTSDVHSTSATCFFSLVVLHPYTNGWYIHVTGKIHTVGLHWLLAARSNIFNVVVGGPLVVAACVTGWGGNGPVTVGGWCTKVERGIVEGVGDMADLRALVGLGVSQDWWVASPAWLWHTSTVAGA